LADDLELYGLGRSDDGRLTVSDLLTECRERANKAVVGLDYQGAPRSDPRKKGLLRLTYKAPEDEAARSLHDTLRAALRWLVFLSIRRSGAPGYRFADCDIEGAPAKLRALADALAPAQKEPNGAGLAEGSPVPLDDDELEILFVLDERETLATNEQIRKSLATKEIERSPTTIKGRVNRLRDKGLVERISKRSGVRITQAGKARVQA
jgi:hypothetical protein